MRAAIIDQGVVINVIEVDSLDFIPGLIDGAAAAIGDTWDGTQFVKPPAPAPTLADYDKALDDFLDGEAASHGWKNRITCALRAGYPNEWRDTGTAFGVWMDVCNGVAIKMQNDFVAGSIPQPTIEEMLAALPEMVWP